MASSLAALNGFVPRFLQGHPHLRWAWLGLMAALLVWVVVLMQRLRREKGCA